METTTFEFTPEQQEVWNKLRDVIVEFENALAEAVPQIVEFIQKAWEPMSRELARLQMEREGWTGWVAKLLSKWLPMHEIYILANKYSEWLDAAD